MLYSNWQKELSRGHSVQYYFNALLWGPSENNVRQTGWQAAKIHELIKLLLPLGLCFSQKWKPNKFTVPFKPNLSLHLLWEQQNPLYRSLFSLYIHTNTHTLTFAVAVSGASSHWQGKRSERPLLNTWMHSHNCWWNPVICFSEIKKNIRLIDFTG